MKTRKKSRGFTKQIIPLCKSASLLMTTADLTVSTGPSLTRFPARHSQRIRSEAQQQLYSRISASEIASLYESAYLPLLRRKKGGLAQRSDG
ncbi:hypothetical protein [Paenibacillus prosopidis]|uniref:Uncharacterized protein n=1 Tax=Paenibacillus prosopidis TaxID=630520 RepID=A0A368VL98_9BACL|nr:hypothetical protein [Paenibacillus prosopidis]RCW42471.1 hypothetical protein DFP97_11633 [Paenibacillus prosopidis]